MAPSRVPVAARPSKRAQTYVAAGEQKAFHETLWTVAASHRTSTFGGSAYEDVAAWHAVTASAGDIVPLAQRVAPAGPRRRRW